MDLNPYAYHVAVFVLFFLTTCVVYIFLRRLTGDALVAALGTTFFSLHSTNLYVTYDLAFAPELFYTSFYLLSLVFYLRWAAGNGTRRWYLASLGTFVLALMSKEAAVTLPANLALIARHAGAAEELARSSRVAPSLEAPDSLWGDTRSIRQLHRPLPGSWCWRIRSRDSRRDDRPSPRWVSVEY